MWLVHPFQKHFCVLYLSIALIASYLTIKKHSINHNQIDSIQHSITDNESIIFENLLFANESVYEYDGNNEYEIKHDILFNKSQQIEFSGNYSHTLYILGLFELSTRWGVRFEGVSEMMAAQLAVNHINNNNILPGYKLELLKNDTKCDPGIGIDRFFHALYSNKTILMLLGSSCSNVTERLAHVVPYWNILQVSFGSTSPYLSDRNKFPLFFRTVAPDSSHNNAKINFVKEFRWPVVATFSQTENKYLLPLNNLVTELEKENVSCITTITFSFDNFKEQLKALKDLDVRIIIASFSTYMAPKIFCSVYELNMYGGDYVWILQEQQELWWNDGGDCSKDELKQSVEGIIFVNDYDKSSINEPTISGLDDESFATALNMSLKNISKYAKQAYDAVWAMALVLRETQMRFWLHYIFEDFDYNRKDMVCWFVDKMSKMRFEGLSGPVQFQGADRIGNSIIKQIQNGELKDIAIFDSIRKRLDFQCTTCQNIYWKNGQVPIAQRILKVCLISVPEILFYFVTGICLMGIAASILFLYFNLHFRRMKSVKLSSPKLNNVCVFGCMFVYFSVILLGINIKIQLTNIYFRQLCMIRTYLMSAGFSLAFGSMFAKTYRVHRLFTYGASLVKDRILKDKQLIALILIPLVIDGIIITLWVMIDPMERHLHNLTLQLNINDLGVVYQPQVEICLSNNTVGWYIALYGYKALILIMAAFMAWKTKHIKVAALNDSQYIGICVYSAVFSAIIVVLCNFISNYTIFSYIATTASIITSTTITLFMLFLPKLKSVFGKVQTEDPVMQSLGFKIECNTRRFISNDPRELICRLEIQNKVYKCELEALDKEIIRLEELLLYTSTTCSTKSSENMMETAVDCHYLSVPTTAISRASWPTGYERALMKPRKDFLSENKLNNEHFFDKFNIFGKLKRIFGSIPSVTVNSCSINGQENELVQIDGSRKLTSNPEFYSQLITPFNVNLTKAKSEIYIISKREI